MEKATWVKIVWLGALLAIPAAVLAVQKPEAARPARETHRIMALDQPVAVDISDHQIEAPKPAEAASGDAPKPQAMRLGTEKITSKAAGAPVDSPKAPVDSPKAKMSEPGGPKEQSLAAALTAVPGPQTAPTP